jgi:hypothetical protein
MPQSKKEEMNKSQVQTDAPASSSLKPDPSTTKSQDELGLPRQPAANSDKKTAYTPKPFPYEHKLTNTHTSPTSFFSRADNIDTRHAVFNDVARDQFNIAGDQYIEIKVCS